MLSASDMSEQIKDEFDELDLRHAISVFNEQNWQVIGDEDSMYSDTYEHDIPDLLEELGLNSPEGIKAVQEYLLYKQEREEPWWKGDFTDDYNYRKGNTILERLYDKSVKREKIQQTINDEKNTKEGGPKTINKIIEDTFNEYVGRDEDKKGIHDEEQKKLEGLIDEVDNFQDTIKNEKEDLVKDFDISDDLLDSSVEQAQEFATSPSLVDATIESSLSDNLRSDIQKRMADRSRYGSLKTNPEDQQGADRIAFGKARVKAKLEEAQLKERGTIDAMSTIGGLKANLALEKQRILKGRDTSNLGPLGSNLDRKHRVLNQVTQLRTGKLLGQVGATNLRDDENLRQGEYDKFGVWQDKEGFRKSGRVSNADDKRRLGAAKIVGGAGATLLSPELGTSIIGSGLNDTVNSSIDRSVAGRPTPGLYGSKPKYFNPSVYTPGPSPVNKSKEYGNQLNDIYNLLNDKNKAKKVVG